jgi:hypothetical protein
MVCCTLMRFLPSVYMTDAQACNFPVLHFETNIITIEYKALNRQKYFCLNHVLQCTGQSLRLVTCYSGSHVYWLSFPSSNEKARTHCHTWLFGINPTVAGSGPCLTPIPNKQWAWQTGQTHGRSWRTLGMKHFFPSSHLLYGLYIQRGNFGALFVLFGEYNGNHLVWDAYFL